MKEDQMTTKYNALSTSYTRGEKIKDITETSEEFGIWATKYNVNVKYPGYFTVVMLRE